MILYRMKHALMICAALAAAPSFALAKETGANAACESATIETAASVETPYGGAYEVETYYRSPDEAAARFITDKPALMVIEGPHVWIESADGAALGGDDERRFIIGHQFHALAYHFDEIMTDVKRVKKIEFLNGVYKGRKGAYPLGGEATLVLDEDKRPIGLLMELPDKTRIEVSYSDFRETPSGESAPYKASILQNGNLFTYSYSEVDFGRGSAASFQGAFPAPAIEPVSAYRAGQTDAAANCGP